MIETNNVEFKRELNDKFEKEVVSFLNSKGGHILLELMMTVQYMALIMLMNNN